jgi:hypothetical protein
MVKFYYANDGKHKLVAEFHTPHQLVPFGALNYNDYTIYYQQDPKLAQKHKTSYLRRHKKNEDWDNPRTAGALSRWVLWNKPTIDKSIEDYIRRFNMDYD